MCTFLLAKPLQASSMVLGLGSPWTTTSRDATPVSSSSTHFSLMTGALCRGANVATLRCLCHVDYFKPSAIRVLKHSGQKSGASPSESTLYPIVSADTVNIYLHQTFAFHLYLNCLLSFQSREPLPNILFCL